MDPHKVRVVRGVRRDVLRLGPVAPEGQPSIAAVGRVGAGGDLYCAPCAGLALDG